jgi:hypothetical protein
MSLEAGPLKYNRVMSTAVLALLLGTTLYMYNVRHPGIHLALNLF